MINNNKLFKYQLLSKTDVSVLKQKNLKIKNYYNVLVNKFDFKNNPIEKLCDYIYVVKNCKPNTDVLFIKPDKNTKCKLNNLRDKVVVNNEQLSVTKYFTNNNVLVFVKKNTDSYMYYGEFAQTYIEDNAMCFNEKE